MFPQLGSTGQISVTSKLPSCCSLNPTHSRTLLRRHECVRLQSDTYLSFYWSPQCCILSNPRLPANIQPALDRLRLLSWVRRHWTTRFRRISPTKPKHTTIYAALAWWLDATNTRDSMHARNTGHHRFGWRVPASAIAPYHVNATSGNLAGHSAQEYWTFAQCTKNSLLATGAHQPSCGTKRQSHTTLQISREVTPLEAHSLRVVWVDKMSNEAHLKTKKHGLGVSYIPQPCTVCSFTAYHPKDLNPHIQRAKHKCHIGQT